MEKETVKQAIDLFRQIQEKDAITPETLGVLLQSILDAAPDTTDDIQGGGDAPVSAKAVIDYLASLKGKADGLASLGSNGKVPLEQLPMEVSLDEIQNMSAALARIQAGGKAMPPCVAVKDNSGFVVGVLMQYSDSSAHALVQALLTSYTLGDDGSFNGHKDGELTLYHRYIDMHAGIASATWGAWQRAGADTKENVEKLQERADAMKLWTGAIAGTVQDLQELLEEGEQTLPQQIKAASRQTFIDLWNALGKYNNKIYGKYDPDNAPDKEHPYMLNKLYMTYEEAVAVVAASKGAAPILNSDIGTLSMFLKCRTYFPFYFRMSSKIDSLCCLSTCEVVRLVDYGVIELGKSEDTELIRVSSTSGAFSACYNLREVLGLLDLSGTSESDHFYSGSYGYSSVLEKIWLNGVRANISKLFRYTKVIELECLQYLVTNAANTAPITVTVHADVYGKMTSGQNDEWTKLLSDAVARQISFATA